MDDDLIGAQRLLIAALRADRDNEKKLRETAEAELARVMEWAWGECCCCKHEFVNEDAESDCSPPDGKRDPNNPSGCAAWAPAWAKREGE